MCGRGGLDFDWKTLWRWMDLAGTPPEGGVRRLNVAPSRRRRGDVDWTTLPVVRGGGDARRVDDLVWPLVPFWLRGELPRYATANCRSEPGQPFSATVARKPAFREAWKRGRRCLVPMSWFYEWDKRVKPSQPWRVLPARDPLLAMAGLWDRSQPPDGAPFDSFTIVTTQPNEQLAGIGHDRSPVLLRPDVFDTWLGGDAAAAEALIGPPAEDLLRVEAVTRRVNNPEYEGDDLLEASGEPANG
jgi:putative SOS response-associated peptidase YedK